MNLKDVIRLVGWYKQRWHIEQLFRIMKNQGFQIEDSQLENYSSLSKMCTLVLLSSIEVLKLTISREGKNKRTFDDVFETYDKDLFLKINSKCEGKTKKQKNPHRDRKSTRLNSSHSQQSRMPSSA